MKYLLKSKIYLSKLDSIDEWIAEFLESEIQELKTKLGS